MEFYILPLENIVAFAVTKAANHQFFSRALSPAIPKLINYLFHHYTKCMRSFSYEYEIFLHVTVIQKVEQRTTPLVPPMHLLIVSHLKLSIIEESPKTIALFIKISRRLKTTLYITIKFSTAYAWVAVNAQNYI